VGEEDLSYRLISETLGCDSRDRSTIRRSRGGCVSDAHVRRDEESGRLLGERRGSSYFYWAWTAAHAARHLGKRAWAEALVEEVLRRQHVDGSWRNDATEMRTIRWWRRPSRSRRSGSRVA